MHEAGAERKRNHARSLSRIRKKHQSYNRESARSKLAAYQHLTLNIKNVFLGVGEQENYNFPSDTILC
jgi:hypothetical protein